MLEPSGRQPARTQRLVVFSGLPGTGKTTLAEAVGRVYRLPVFSVVQLKSSHAPPSRLVVGAGVAAGWSHCAVDPIDAAKANRINHPAWL